MARLRIETAPQITVYDESAIFQAASGATANLVEFKNSSNTIVASVSVEGNTVIAGNLALTGNLTVTGTTIASANANTLTGTTLKSTVLNSSLTSVGTLSSLAVSGSATISANVTANNATVSNNLSVGGNLSVTGNIITVNTTTLMVEDNKIIINSTASGVPSENGVIEVERGSSDNVSIRWNETTDAWQLTNDGATFADIQASVTAGAGLSRTANTLNVVSANSSRINVGAGSIDLATVTQTNTTGSAGVSFVQSHSVDAYGRIDGTVTASIRDADTTVKGIALFSAGDFNVSSGEVTIKNSGVDNAQLANSSFTINGTSINLGETSTITANAATLTGTMLPVTVVGSSLTSVGTLTTGVWNGSPVGIAYGGTGQATAPLALTALLPTQTGNSGKYLKTSGSEASWGALTVSDISEITASAAELNILDGATLSTSELNYVDGVTSSIQTQIDAKLATATASSTYETITNVNLKADIASPTFTGVPSAPTANSTTNTTQVATTAFVKSVISDLVGTAAANLDTLGEISDALNDDASYAATIVTALAAKAPLANPTFTGTVAGITKAMVNLTSVDDTSDANKPVSTAQQAALDLKANLANPSLTGVPTAPTAASTTSTVQIATTEFVQQEITALVGGAPGALNTLNELATALGNNSSFSTTVTNSIALKAPIDAPTFTGIVTIPAGALISGYATLANPTFTGTVSGITKSMVGLGNVDNTADAAKPVSADQQAALNLKANIASPTFTGVVTIPMGASISGFATLMSPIFTGVPEAPTAAAATNTTQIATTAFVRAEVAALVGSAGSTLDTLGEIATALGNDANLSATLTTSIGLKANTASPTFTGNVTIPAGANIAGYVTLTGSETLTNKTFTSPVTNSPTLTLANTSSTTDARISWDSTNKKIQVGNGTVSLDFASSNITTNAQAASYTLVLSDKDKMIEISNASANTITIPPNSSVAFPIGTQVRILQTGVGQCTVTAGAGVTVNGTPGLKLRAQWSSVTLVKRATDTWVAIGDLAA